MRGRPPTHFELSLGKAGSPPSLLKMEKATSGRPFRRRVETPVKLHFNRIDGEPEKQKPIPLVAHQHALNWTIIEKKEPKPDCGPRGLDESDDDLRADIAENTRVVFARDTDLSGN